MDKGIVLTKLNIWRLWPADCLYFLTKARKEIDADLARLSEQIPYKHLGLSALNYELLLNQAFRSVFFYRTQDRSILRYLARLFLPVPQTIEIHGKIEGGFAVYHHYAVIHPHSAGKNFTVNQGVTIGKGKGMQSDPEIIDPVFGDNVTIYSNACVFGGIRIGNDVKIGAGAVVNKDVPDHCTVVGNPMRIIRNS